MKRFLSLLATVTLLTSLTGCCCSGLHGGGFNQGSYYQPPYTYGAPGGCPGGACGVQPQQAPLYPQGSLYGPTSALPASNVAPGPVASYPYIPQQAYAPLQGAPVF